MQHVETILATHVDVDFDARQFDGSAWAGAHPVHITRYWSGGEAPVGSHAEARIIWSNESLHVRFVCHQNQPLIISPNPQLDQKTIGLWNRDVCEIFIAPFPDQPHRYFEFEAAPTGEWVDLAVRFNQTNRENDFEYRSGMTVGARVAGDQITVSMRIPWSDSIPKPTMGDEWRANLFRCVGLGNERYLAWQPTFTAEPNFHLPEAFGRVLFI
jgi:alpha-galactosidase